MAHPNGGGEANEILEWVDERNIVQGSKPRGEIHETGLRHRSVHIAVFDREGRLFLHRRAPSKLVLPNRWDISAAGHVNPGESYAAAARRELREELGLTLPLEFLQVSEAGPETGHEFAALCVAEVPDPQALRPCAEEIAEGRFFGPEDLRKLLGEPSQPVVPSMLHILRTLLDGGGTSLFPGWRAEDRESVREAVVSHASYPGDIGPSELSAALLLEKKSPLRAPLGGAMPGLRLWLEKAIFACLVACVAAGILFYPLQLNDSRLTVFREASINLMQQGGSKGQVGRLAMTDVYPFISGTLTPLPLKEAAMSWLILAALPLFLTLLALRPATSLVRRPLFLVLLLLAGWASASLFFVLPQEWMFLGATTLGHLLLFLTLAAMSGAVLDSAERQKRMIIFAAVPLGLMALISLTQNFADIAILPEGTSIRNRMSSTIGHNNGVASVALYLWFPCLAAIFLARRRWSLMTASAGAILLCFLFLYLQTRAIWGALGVLTPPFLWLAARERGWHPRLWHALTLAAVLAGAILLQAIDHPMNPFHAEPSIVTRLRELSPAKLRQTTQARILALSAPYMADDPKRALFGVGIGSFSAIYPRMQAEFFAADADRVDQFYLPSAKRTAQAHSDALQLFIELGAVGLLLLFAFLWTFAKHAEAAWQSARDSRARLWLLAIFFPLTGTCLHGIVEFPFHVAPTMVCFCVFLGMAFAAPQAWGSAQAEPVPLNILQRALAAPGPAATQFRIGFLVVVLGVWAILLLVSGVRGRLLISDHYQKMSESLIQTYYADPEQRLAQKGDQMLEISRDYLRRALRLTPASDSELLLRRGSLLSILAHIIMSRVEIARQQGAEPVAIKAARDTARIYLRSALDELIAAQEQGAEYFKTHFELALICQGLATLATSPEERRKYDALYEIELRLSHRFNPSFDSPIVFLLDRFESQRQPSDPELARWRKLLLAQAPDRYSERYAEPLAEAMKLGEFARAHWFLDVIQIDQPKEPIYRFSEALLLARQGESAAAQDLLKRLKSEFPDFELYPDFAAIVALFARDWPEARRWAEEALAGKSNRRDLPMMETVRAYAAEAAGDPDGARLVARVERLAMQDNKKEAVPWLDAASNVLHVHLGQTERALPFMRRRAGIFEPTGPDEIFLVELARHTDNLDAARGYLKEALIAQPRNREALALVAEKFGGASSPEAGRILAEAAEERRARDRAERAKSFRELMDSQGF